jgi:hypothetical protein
MDIGWAVARMKDGDRVRRAGWNGKGMWIALSGPAGPRSVPADGFWSEHNKQFAIEQGGAADVLPCVTMKTADGMILMGWLASQTDLLATDWGFA